MVRPTKKRLLARKITEHCKENNISIMQVAKPLKLEKAQVNDLFAGNVNSFEVRLLEKIANFLGVTL